MSRNASPWKKSPVPHDLCHDGSDLPAAVVGGVILPGGDELTGQQSSDSRLHIRIGGKKLSSAVGS
jgi:hypothetical protein